MPTKTEKTRSTTDENLIQECWEDRAGRPVTDGNERYTLILAYSRPPTNISEPVNMVLSALEQVDCGFAYNWSERWGNTRVSSNIRNQNESLFVEFGTSQSNKYGALSSSLKQEAGDYFDHAEENIDLDNAHLLLLNKQPTKLEGAILQVERMLDELVWRLTTEMMADLGLTSDAAYQKALEDIRRRGVGVRYSSESDILNIKRERQETAVRIYGNIFGHDTVANVIGAIVKDKDHFINIGTPPTRRMAESVPKLVLPTTLGKRAVVTAVTVAKKPHVGHLFHDAVATTTANTYDVDSKILIANDIGPRIVGTVLAAADALGCSTEAAVAKIMDGTISSEQLEKFYQVRHSTDEFYSHEAIVEGLSLTTQAKEWCDAIDMTDPSSKLKSAIIQDSETTTDLYRAIVGKLSPQWEGYGFASVEFKGGMITLEKNGQPTSGMARIGSLLRSIGNHSLSEVVVVDQSREIKTATELLMMLLENTVAVHTTPGGAVGFLLEIASGSKGNSVPIPVENWKSQLPLKKAAQVVVATKYQVTKMNSEAFLDFANPDSLYQSLIDANKSISEFEAVINGRIGLAEYAGCEIGSTIDFITNDGMLKKHFLEVLKTKGVIPSKLHIPNSAAAFREISGRKLLRTTSQVSCNTPLKGQSALYEAARQMLIDEDHAVVYSDLFGILHKSGYETSVQKIEFLEKAIKEKYVMQIPVTPLSLILGMLDTMNKHVRIIDLDSERAATELLKATYKRYFL